MFARPQRRFVKPPRLQCRDDRVFRGLGRQNVVGVIRDPVRGTIGRCRWFRGFLGPASRGQFQLQPIYNLLWCVAVVGLPFEQTTLKWRAILTDIFLLTVDRHRQSCPAAQWPRRTRVAQTSVNHRIEQPHSHSAVGERFRKDDTALMIAGACLDQP